jgi:Fe-Mn family superoxide dismutase
MAHNNHFFFQGLSPHETVMPEPLKVKLEESFSSIATLRQEMTVTARAMFGPGFVWLVQSRNGTFSLLTTYLAGSPYPQAHYRQQPVDMNTEEKSFSETMRRKIRESPVNSIGAHGAKSEAPLGPGAADINPVLCINTWERVYLQDYGFVNKKAYVESWWHAIDWNIVAANASLSEPGFGKYL